MRTVKIKRTAYKDRYLLADWYREKFPLAIIYTPEDFGYVRFEQ